MVTENTELMNRQSCVTKYDQDANSAASSNRSQSTLSNNSQNRLYEKLSFSRQHLQTLGVLGNTTFLSLLKFIVTINCGNNYYNEVTFKRAYCEDVILQYRSWSDFINEIISNMSVINVLEMSS